MNEQHELYENARNRVQQEKRLYFHFIFFLIGSIFFIVLNKILKVGESFMENWFVWVILLWLFFLTFHFINVFFTNRFMGKDWERKQIDKLVLKQKVKIADLEKELKSNTKLETKSKPSTTELKENKTPKTT